MAAQVDDDDDAKCNDEPVVWDDNWSDDEQNLVVVHDDEQGKEEDKNTSMKTTNNSKNADSYKFDDYGNAQRLELKLQKIVLAHQEQMSVTGAAISTATHYLLHFSPSGAPRQTKKDYASQACLKPDEESLL